MIVACTVLAHQWLSTTSGAVAAADWQPAPGYKQEAIWPGTPPDALPTGPETVETVKDKLVAGKPWIFAGPVSRPTITVYPPNGKNNPGEVSSSRLEQAAEIGALSEIESCAARCATRIESGALSCRGPTYRSTQNRSDRFFSRRASGGSDEHTIYESSLQAD